MIIPRGKAILKLGSASIATVFVVLSALFWLQRSNAATAGHRTVANVDFRADVRPILSRACFECHGPDASARRADLRLDLRDAGLDGVIVPGDASASLLYERLVAADPADRMPPPDSRHRLDAEEVDAIRRWIDEGAIWADHWSFEPPRASTAPISGEDGWSRDLIDRFIRRGFDANGLSPAGSATRELLLRRVTFDLTGLPPTLEAQADFLADERPDAYEHVVDRLLASSAFGERMAVDWLDLARYADTYGYQSDVDRAVWPYRDWVIDAFNRNLPYDDFAVWQLAGDLLPEPTREQRLATAFNRLHRQTNEGGSVEEEFRVEYVADRVHTFGTTFLGLTTECARCHTHKFDPITHDEYYGLFAFFDDIDESGLYSHFTNATPTPTLLLDPPDATTRIAELRRAIAATEASLGTVTDDDRAAFDAWFETRSDRGLASLDIPGLVGDFPLDAIVDGGLENSVDAELSGRVAGAPIIVDGAIGSGIRLDGENNLHFPGIAAFSRFEPFSIALWIRIERTVDRAVVLHRSRAWTDAGSQGYQFLLESGRPSWSLIHFWPGNAISIRGSAALPEGRWIQIGLVYDGSSRADGLGLFVDGSPVEVDVIRDRLTKSITGGGPGAMTIGQRFRDRGFKGGSVDHLQVFDRALTPIEWRALHGGSTLDQPDASDRDAWYAYHRATRNPARDAMQEALRGHRRELAALLDRTPEIMVMEDFEPPREARVLERGRYDRPLHVVEPGVPASLGGFPDALPRNRLGLARWLVDPGNPLAARVAVNRLWMIVFGRGLVATPEDFGAQGEPPSHPELLDRLAIDFIESGWDVKAMLRRLVLTSTYRQSSMGSEAAKAIDPENRWYARGPSGRLTAEMIRDQALAASGLLVPDVGGPSVHPYQPAGLWQEKSGRTYPQGSGEALHRRSMYTFWKRTSPPPSMMIFDSAKRDVCLARRGSTSTPLQALVLLNDVQFMEAARVLAERVIAAHPDDATAGIADAFRRLTGRSPRRDEAISLGEMWAEERAAFAADPDAAGMVAATGDSPARPGLDAVEVATMTLICSTIMNTDASVTRR